MSFKEVAIIALLFAGLCVVLMILIILQKIRLIRRHKRLLNIQELLMRKYILHEDVRIRCSAKMHLRSFFMMSQSYQFNENAMIALYNFYKQKGLITKMLKCLNHNHPYTRKKAIAYLSVFRNHVTIKALSDHLRKESEEHVKIHLINALKKDIDEQVLKAIIASLISSRRAYQKRVIMILKKYLNQTKYDLSAYFNHPLIEVKESFIDLSKQLYHPTFKAPLLATLKEIEDHYALGNSAMLAKISKPRIDRLYHQTLQALSTYYDFDITQSRYLLSSDDEVVRIAVNCMAKNGDFETIISFLKYASQTKRDEIFAEGIRTICNNQRSYYQKLYQLFLKETTPRKKNLIAQVLSHRLDHLLITIKDYQEMRTLVEAMVNSRFTVNIINWLNENKDEALESRLLSIIKPIAENNYDFYLELNNYLEPVLFQKMDFIHTANPAAPKPDVEPNLRKHRWLMTILIISIVLLPFIFVLTNLGSLFNRPFIEIAEDYLVSINIWFIAYYLFVNTLYIVFAFIAMVEYRRQEKLWNIKSYDLLFEEGILEPISIIVPAYNEALNIEENVKSLLNLEYPKYEVVVVNDGSKDETLKALIEAFDLRRVDYKYDQKIQTRHVKAVYKNRFYGNLVVIDKVNGGKADALNVGINFSQYDYVCGIDADSLIESDGLLKMMSTVLDSDEITLALGGSIVPANGASVSHGVVDRYELPKSYLTRLQAIEYLRAFNTGRLAFSRLKCFLIISGAFGLFEKRILTEIGGYLSASSFKKNTVGEDMELVVRLTKQAAEHDLNYRVEYVPMARCYTEVPSQTKILLNQRNRWQRGLIETLSFHRGMILNPKYHANGMFAMPYFFVFEMIAPLLEIQIYVTLIIGLIFGIFSLPFIVLLLVVTILYGSVLSLVSLLIQEKYATPLSLKDVVVLIFYSVIENFGWRQMTNMHRAFGFFSSLKGKHTWGSMTRVGFKK